MEKMESHALALPESIVLISIAPVQLANTDKTSFLVSQRSPDIYGRAELDLDFLFQICMLVTVTSPTVSEHPKLSCLGHEKSN